MDKPKLKDYILNEDGSVKHYDFKDKKDFKFEPKMAAVRPGSPINNALRGIMHDGTREQACVSDGHVLILTRQWYDDENAGKAICAITDKKNPGQFTEGNEIKDAKWIPYECVVAEPEGGRFETPFNWEVAKHVCMGLRAYINDLYSALKEKGLKYTKDDLSTRYIIIRTVYDDKTDTSICLSAAIFDKLVRMAALIGASDNIYIQSPSICVIFEAEKPEDAFERDLALAGGVSLNAVPDAGDEDIIIEVSGLDPANTETVKFNFSDFDELG